MGQCVFSIRVKGSSYTIICSEEGAKKLIREQELWDVPMIWQTAKPGWMNNLGVNTGTKKAA